MMSDKQVAQAVARGLRLVDPYKCRGFCEHQKEHHAAEDERVVSIILAAIEGVRERIEFNNQDRQKGRYVKP